MPVFEFRVAVVLAAVPMLEELLSEREEQKLMLLEDMSSARAWVMGYFQSHEEAAAGWGEFSKLLDDAWIVGTPDLRELPDADWKNSYRMHFKRTSFGPLHWVPVWERETFRLPEGEKVLWLDPGMAFGTGNHETTRLVAERLVEFSSGSGTTGPVIDAGCGSGILALSAALLGFGQVSGFDNDPEAIRVSEENAAINGLTGRVEFKVGDLNNGWKHAPAALVLANIQADVLIQFADQLTQAVLPGGHLVMSGILARELASVRKVMAATVRGWRTESRTLGEWSDLVFSRRQSD